MKAFTSLERTLCQHWLQFLILSLFHCCHKGSLGYLPVSTRFFTMLFTQQPDWSSPNKCQLTTWLPNAFRANSKLSPWLLRITTTTALAHWVLALLLAFFVLESHWEWFSLESAPRLSLSWNIFQTSMMGAQMSPLQEGFSWWSCTSLVSFPIPFYYPNTLFSL